MAATPKSATKWQALSPSTPAALQFPPVAPWKTRKCSKAPDSLATRGVPPATHQSTTGLVADRPDLSDQTIWPSHFVARGRSRDIQGTVQGTIQD